MGTDGTHDLTTISDLSYPERLLLYAIARTSKAGGTRPFTVRELLKKKLCRHLPVTDLLESLASKRVVEAVVKSKQLWRVVDTHLEHGCEKWILEQRYPGFADIIRR